MKILEIDLKKYNTKQNLFSYLMTQIEGLFASNYDALIDALTFYNTPFTLLLNNVSAYEEYSILLDTLEIIHKENPLILYKAKA